MPPKRVPSASAIPPSTATPSQPSASQTPQKTPTTAIPASTKTPSKTTTTSGVPVSSTTTSSSSRNPQDAQEILQSVYRRYVDTTPQRVKLIDVFLGFLVVVGVLQFVYCVIAGNYPFNAFLSGFSATVGQFVLTASLRIQTNPDNKGEFKSISPERAFADYVLGSLILHFFCVNFIN